MQESIVHDGVITTITGNSISIKIAVSSACASCHAKAVCGSLNKEDRIVVVHDKHPEKYEINEQVEVIISSQTGFRALFLGYILPLIVLLITLFSCWAYSQNELFSGFISLIAVVLYYIALYIFRNKINPKFSFSIGKKHY